MTAVVSVDPGKAVHIVILGCGRVGAALSRSLEAQGHSVAVIDQDANAFRRLSDDFAGLRVTGVGFDRDTLAEAGIERADAFAAVSSGDNSNIIAARVARERFGVRQVVARIYDPRRAEVYERLGIPTVATVRWTADQMLRRLLPQQGREDWADPSGGVVLAEVGLHPGWVGHKVRALEEAADVRVVCLTRFGEGSLPTPTSLLQDGDIIHVAYARERQADVERVLAGPPEGGR